MPIVNAPRFVRMALATVCLIAPVHLCAQESTAVIEAGSQVSLAYTLSIAGKVVETNVGGEPLIYTQGGGQILPALEAALAGLRVGDEKTVNLTAAEGYGEVNPEMITEVPLESVPVEGRSVGALLQSPQHPAPIRVAEVRDDVALLDFNHPMAGKDLSFAITVVDIAAGTPPQ